MYRKCYKLKGLIKKEKNTFIQQNLSTTNLFNYNKTVFQLFIYLLKRSLFCNSRSKHKKKKHILLI